MSKESASGGSTNAVNALESLYNTGQLLSGDTLYLVLDWSFPVRIYTDNGVCITFSQKSSYLDNLIFVYIPAYRNKFIVPNAIETVNIEEKTWIITSLG